MRERARITRKPGELSRTKQSFADELNFNVIVAKYKATGQASNVRRGDPVYGSFDQNTDLQGAMARVDAMRAAFDGLGSKVREAAENDPLTFAEMLDDPAGQEILQAAGLNIFDPERLVDDVTDKVTMPKDVGERPPNEEVE